MSTLLATSLLAPPALAGVTDPDLMATAELPDGQVLNEMELGTLHFFDDEGQPYAIQAIDGCAVNDHVWVFGAGLSGVPIAVTVSDRDTNRSVRVLLPAFEPGVPIGTQLDPEALRVCDEESQVGGLPPLDAVATFTSANARGSDATDVITLLSDGRDDAYSRIFRDGESYPVITRGSPIAAIDEGSNVDQLLLFAESRTPRQLEGIVFSGADGMLPGSARLEKGIEKLTNARVRRAYETAKNRRVPRGIIEDLGLKRVERVHHVSLDFDTLGADAYLAAARWIREGGRPIEPPSPVDARFAVELVTADGTRRDVPLVGPLVGSDAEGRRWEHATEGALVEIIDSCALSGSFWTWAGVATDEPVELVITDTTDGTSVSHLVWTDRRDVSRHADTSALTSCP
ncbi:MAG: hypothetical protein AB1Z66_11745 [Candidatus Limnocylindrales bacterium]